MPESTAAIAPPPENLDLKSTLVSESDEISVPPLDHLFFSASDPISMETPISDIDFLLDDENGDFRDLDFDFDNLGDYDNLDDIFDFSLDAAAPDEHGGFGEEIGNHPGFGSPGTTKNGEKSSEGRSDSVGSQVSSQGSKTFVSGVSDTVDALSSPDSSQNLGLKSSVSKRKKEKGDTEGEYRSCKYRKSDEKSAATNEEDDDKKKVRLIRNRESAQLSRLRKKQYVEELQGKVKSMSTTIAELNGKISYVMAENVALRQQMAAASASGAPPLNPYMAAPPLPYQWMPYPPYPVRGYGSQTPLVPIPKLNPKPVSGCRPKKSESKKTEGKSKLKKVASVSFLGILFCVFLFGMLAPSMNVNYGGDGGSGLSIYGGHRSYDEHKGNILMVGDGSDVRRESVISEGDIHPSRRIYGEMDSCGGVDYNAHPKVEGTSQLNNASEPLFASLYVPRNDGLVKIDGNLIIHSVLASEKAMAFAKKNTSETLKTKEPDSTVPGTLSSALAVPEVRGNAARLPQSTALSSSSSDGKRLHQWFHEGGSGTLMDYSMCTEVFQFDIAPGAIVPSTVSNISAKNLQNVTTNKRMKNRRTLEGIPVSLVASELNITGAQPSENAQNKSFHGTTNKPTSSSSMVVSVLLDPREIVDSETDSLIPPKPKSLSRIFVVVLLDSVKYVTYSCVLPRSSLHLVAT